MKSFFLKTKFNETYFETSETLHFKLKYNLLSNEKLETLKELNDRDLDMVLYKFGFFRDYYESLGDPIFKMWSLYNDIRKNTPHLIKTLIEETNNLKQ